MKGPILKYPAWWRKKHWQLSKDGFIHDPATKNKLELTSFQKVALSKLHGFGKKFYLKQLRAGTAGNN